MEQQLIRKFKQAGATSEENAVTFEEAKLDMQECCWVNNFAGTFLGRTKKTSRQRYYLQKTTRYTEYFKLFAV